jgi:hypothetical protein
MAIENVGGGCSLCRERERVCLLQNIQNYLEWSWQFCKRFCGSGENSLVPNTHPKSFVSCGGKDRVFQEFESSQKWK